MLKPADKAPSKCAVREDVWVRIPPAAPIVHAPRFDCRASPPDAAACADRREIGGMYVYLLGLYLGDGNLVQVRKRVWKLRVTLDQRYESIVQRCEAAIVAVSAHTAGRAHKIGCIDVYSTWKHWVCLFPQHGRGPKHRRPIALAEWQRVLVDAYPGEFVRGLIHSDGCRALNRITHRRNGVSKTYTYPRYMFSNRSADIRQLFTEACAAIGVESRPNNWFSISVARKRSVAILEEVVGPKR